MAPDIVSCEIELTRNRKGVKISESLTSISLSNSSKDGPLSFVSSIITDIVAGVEDKPSKDP